MLSNIYFSCYSSKDHPLRQFLLQYQYHVYRKLLPLLKDVNFPSEKNLNTANQDDISISEGSSCSNDNNMNTFNGDDEKHELDTKEEVNDGKSSPEERKYDIKELDNFSNSKYNDLNNQHTDNTEENISNIQSNDCYSEGGNTLQEDIETIVNRVLEDILEKVTESSIYEEQKDISGEMQEGINSKVTDTDKGQELHILNETESTKLPNKSVDDNNLSQENEHSSTTTVSDVSNKEIIKNRNLLRIKSFDVDSEFESLEDDMFDSESSGDEEEQTENASNNKQHTSSTFTQEDSTTEVERENVHERSTDTEGVASVNSMKEEAVPKLSYEEDLEMTRKQLNEIFVDMRFFLGRLSYSFCHILFCQTFTSLYMSILIYRTCTLTVIIMCFMSMDY